MTMTETPVETPKPKRKYTRKAKAAKPKAANEFAGITATDCCSGCSVTGCVISGRPYCAHPYKGGLQGADIGNDAAVMRLNASKKLLGKKKVAIPATA